MAQSADERRGYSRGYNRAGARYWERVSKVVEIARGYQRRLADIDTARTCSNCQRWTRGGGQANSASCHWGSCCADFEWGMEPRMWVDLPIGAPKNLKTEIITQPEFGCVSWLPKTPTA